jgi:hypothetical protein
MLSLVSSIPAFNVAAAAPPAVSRAAVTMSTGLAWSDYGSKTWDPLNLAKTPEKFEKLRYVEVKHGRIAMLACLGHWAAGSGFRFPGELSESVKFADISGTGLQAMAQVPIVDHVIIFLSIGFLELRVMKEVVKGEFPGDLRNGLFTEGWDEFSEADKKRKINIELNNGRAAMMGIFGMMVHEMLGVSPYFPTTPGPW